MPECGRRHTVLSVGVFDRTVVGVDASDFGFEALRQALALRAPDSALRAVVVLEEAAASHAGFLAGDAAARLEEGARQTYEMVVELLEEQPSSSASLIQGSPATALLSVCEEERATLVAVGGRHRSRTAGLLLSGVSTVVLHDAPCSVLFAHPQRGERWSPRRILVGLDGSSPSLAALAAADELAGRLGSALHVVSATGGKRIEMDAPWAERVDDWLPGDPVVNLVDGSIQVDLVVVGSRGLHGLRSLGSVSERVAHRAQCSVLVVKDAEAPGTSASATPIG